MRGRRVVGEDGAGVARSGPAGRGHADAKPQIADHNRSGNSGGLSLSSRVTAVAVACDILCWTRLLLLDGDRAAAGPHTLRYRLLHTGGRITKRSHETTLLIPETWLWAEQLAYAFTRTLAITLVLPNTDQSQGRANPPGDVDPASPHTNPQRCPPP